MFFFKYFVKLSYVNNYFVVLKVTKDFVGCCIDSCNVYGIDCQYYQDRGHTTSGVYHVNPEHTHAGYDVYCDMTTDGGGWLVKYLKSIVLSQNIILA